ncbi:MAG: DUF2304 domain-containing protein [Lachnospiraceae bacterium]|nr:DUF2304 domain-containing protein [Lachnospiraceae bacterium]
MFTGGLVVKLLIIITGLIMLFITIGSLAKRKMTETFCLAWFVVSFAVTVAGIVVQPDSWDQYISFAGMMLLFVIFYGAVYAAYNVSLKISELSRKNQELAIQVSLLNQENEKLLRRLSEHLDINVEDL